MTSRRTGPPTLGLAVVAALAALTLVAAGCTHSTDSDPAAAASGATSSSSTGLAPCSGPDGVTARPPAGTGPGDLVAAAELTGAYRGSPGFPTGARAWRILYVSTAVDEHDLRLVCGTVVAPSAGPATFDTAEGPAGRLVAWAHGTIGLDQRCLPSSDPATHIWGPMPTGIQTVSWGSLLGAHDGTASGGALQYAMDHRWVVAATDYQPDDSYIIGKVAAANVLDSSRAATQLMTSTFPDRTPGRYDLLTWGHSQGGHAALWAGQLAESYLTGTSPRHRTPPIDLVGVVALAPAGNFVVQPERQPGLSYGDGVADREMHQAISAVASLPIPALEVQIGPALFSYIFGSWSSFAAGGTPSAGARFPAYPRDAAGLRLDDLATKQGIGTIRTVEPLCLAGKDAATLKQAVAPYGDAATNRMLTPELWNLPSSYRAGQYFLGGVDRSCATTTDAGLTRWCEWIRWNLPGPLGDNPFPKVPERDGRPVPLLMAQGSDDEVIHCVAPSGLAADELPPARDCTSHALYDSYQERAYCPAGGDRGHLELDVFRPQFLQSPASHFSIPGQMSARAQGRSAEDLQFDGSPTQRFMQGAFDRTLRAGCTARIMNP